MGLKPSDPLVANVGTLDGTESIPIDNGTNAALKTTPEDIKTFVGAVANGGGVPVFVASASEPPVETQVEGMLWLDESVSTLPPDTYPVPNYSDILFPINEPIGSHRVVNASGMYANSNVLADAGEVVGISITASSTSISIRTAGPMIEGSWTWTAGPIYLGLNGMLTQTPPTTGFVLEVASAISATSIIINIKSPIFITP